MRYTYAYKTSDGIRHESEMDAPSREKVFETLRKQGIKAIKVVAADGSKANGEVHGVRKRVVVAVVLVAAITVGVVAFSFGVHTTQQTIVPDPQTISPRHQIYGDPVLMEELEHGKFDRFLPQKGDHYLAWYAQPGKLMVPREVSAHQIRNFTEEMISALEAVVSKDVEIKADDPREVRELKQIVNGMHEELRAYLSNGNGTIRSYVRRLNERLQEESLIYERTKRELERETNLEIWDKKNDALRRLGLLTIPNPQE